MLFTFGVTELNKIYLSSTRGVFFLLFLLFIYCVLPSMSNAYPIFSSSFSIPNNITDYKSLTNRQSIMLNEAASYNDQDNTYLKRNERGTRFYIVRDGDYFVLIPDSKHRFTESMRPYIGRRR